MKLLASKSFSSASIVLALLARVSFARSAPQGSHWEHEALVAAENAHNIHPWSRAIHASLVEDSVPDVVRKLSSDEGEMFFHSYWSFTSEYKQAIFGRSMNGAQGSAAHFVATNAKQNNTTDALKPAIRLHFHSHDQMHFGAGHTGNQQARSVSDLFSRSTCPSGTNACATAGYCCAVGASCVQITDTGLGPIACCPTDSTCTGEITSCAAGQTACPQSLGGACCIAGFQCAEDGCIQTVVVTIVSTFTVSASGVTSTFTSTISASTTTMISSSVQPTTETIIATNTLTSTVTSGSSVSTSSTESANAPVRPTTSVSTTTIATTTLVPGLCPTGFYQCSAYYNAGSCCRVGRDCQTTDCPATSSTTLSSNGVSIGVPLTASATTFATGSCATGWSTCTGSGTTAGGCCPSGYGCGSGSCTLAAATSTGIVGKEGASEGNKAAKHPSMFALAAVALIALVFS